MPHYPTQFARLHSVTAALLAVSFGLAALAEAGDVQFDRDIRPILSDTCYACHGPDEQARSSELRLDTQDGAMGELDGHFAIVAGRPDESELVRRILSSDPDEVMPPPEHLKQLTDEQKQRLVEWIRQGAEWSDQWAWSRPQRSELPAVENSSWPQNWIDRFILARLEQEGTHPSDPADRRTLIRRLSFDLLGLPPTPEDVAAFVNDSRDDAVSRLVDRLLQSPGLGSEWRCTGWISCATRTLLVTTAIRMSASRRIATM